jgi:hypothetical protein
MSLMTGIQVVLFERVYVEDDAFGNPVYGEVARTVENVLVAPAGEQEVLDILSLTGRRVAYKLALPKGDTNDWTAGTKVSFFGEMFRTIGDITQGIEGLIPTEWHKIVRVERIENAAGDQQ